MREIHDHKINDFNVDRVVVGAQDTPDADNGNACHVYCVMVSDGGESDPGCQLRFQHGPVSEVGVNGISNEALLAVVLDRMRGFQSSRFSCRENALVITKLEEALHWLHHRTAKRVARGVEGRNEA